MTETGQVVKKMSLKTLSIKTLKTLKNLIFRNKLKNSNYDSFHSIHYQNHHVKEKSKAETLCFLRYLDVLFKAR